MLTFELEDQPPRYGMAKLALTVALGIGTAACAPIATDVAVATPATAFDTTTGWAAPGVQLVDGWDDTVFWADNGYWWWGDDGWMTWGVSGWRWAQPPLVLTSGIWEPWRYRTWRVRDHRWSGRNGRVWTGADRRWSQPRWNTRSGSWGGRGARGAIGRGRR